MLTDQLTALAHGIGTGDIVPYLGPGALAGVVDTAQPGTHPGGE